MTGLVFALGVVLALAGALSVIAGAPIIQIERGWAEVIAGTVAGTGGVVTLAIGVVLLRLQALAQVAQRAVQPLALTAPLLLPEPALPLDEDADELRPTRAPDEPVFVGSDESVAVAPSAVEEHASVEPAPAEPRGRFWRLRRDRTEGSAETEPLSAILSRPTANDAPAPAPLPHDEPVHAEEPVHPDEIGAQAPPSITPDPEDEPPPPRRLGAAPSEVPNVGNEAPARQTSFFQDWRSKPLLRSRQPAVPAPEVPPPLFDSPAQHDDEAPRIDLQASEIDPSRALAIDQTPAFDEPPVPSEPAVIGRYQAGASSYTMYADGAIDVETENGDRHRFGSMDELKAFIARQEQVVT